MSIFENEKAVIDNARGSAEKLGFDVPKLKKQKVMVAHRKCKKCYGKGVITWSFPGNDGNDSVMHNYCSCVSEKEIEVQENNHSK